MDSMTIDSKKAVITDENRAESAKLKQLWEARKHIHGMNQIEFGDRFGIGTQGAVSACLNARMAISLKAGTGFAMGLKCDIAEFSQRLAAQVNAATQATFEAMGPHNAPTIHHAAEVQPPGLYKVSAAQHWPFEMFNLDDWMMLPKKDREDYEALIYGAVHRARKTRRHG